MDSGFNRIYSLCCSNCNDVLREFYPSSPRITIQKIDNRIEIKPSASQKKLTADSHCLLGVAMNCVLLQHGIQNTFLDTMSNIFGLGRGSEHGIQNDKLAAASILKQIGDDSVEVANDELSEYIRDTNDDVITVRDSVDGASGNKAGNNATRQYLYNVNQNINKVTAYDVTSTNEKYGAKQLEHYMASRTIPKCYNMLGSVAKSSGKRIKYQVIADKDVAYTQIVNKCDQYECIQSEKIDDVNHALKPIFKCVKDAKLELDKNIRSKSGLSKNLARHIYRSVQYGLYNKPREYCWNDMLIAVCHYFSGAVHSQCDKSWCPMLKNGKYCPSLAWGKYLDKNHDPIHKQAYDALIAALRNKFPDEQFERIHDLPRSNVNESLHSMCCKKFNKGTRPPCHVVFESIVACTAAHKNDGRGVLNYNIVSLFGNVSNKHKEILNKIQAKCIYNWIRTRSDKYKKLRAKSKKKYMVMMKKRQEYMEKNKLKHTLYKSNCDTPPKKRRKLNTTDAIDSNNTNDNSNNTNNNNSDDTVTLKCPYCNQKK
eukprot:161888_1